MKSIICAAGLALMASTASAETIKVGLLLGLTGPLESIAPLQAKSAELAIAEINNSKAFFKGNVLQAVRGDSTCTDAAAATAAAPRLVTSEKVVAIVGADCSGVTDMAYSRR
ncbi:ABC transporter substrate-binding protein (plasmid) [Rhizobium sp. CC1099]|uniref:ABC transporter substrate-binding protein n=1 Tax=Rhizobium sp. CC1099 TaxID=3039160 RepID=UPI0024B1423B|nr:ABC transporter substrate-binding protein [Rhizobium sp. CC1099]WFU92185.1 ABC transporter substrate-binding protein [Rhizobium sp. CC1099]